MWGHQYSGQILDKTTAGKWTIWGELMSNTLKNFSKNLIMSLATI